MPDNALCLKARPIGKQSIAVLEFLRKNGRKNRLDLEMILGKPLEPTLINLHRLKFVSKGLHGASIGCYDITSDGRKALGETMTLCAPSSAPITSGTMRETYVPALHNRSQNRVSL